MWRDKLQWDESLPQSLDTAWSELFKEVSEVEYGEVPRYVLQPGTNVKVHAFCDASLLAYGASIFERSKGEVKVHLICAKSRLAPSFSLTVPKLEHCTASLLAQLVNDLSNLKLYTGKFYCWPDSSVVLP